MNDINDDYAAHAAIEAEDAAVREARAINKELNAAMDKLESMRPVPGDDFGTWEARNPGFLDLIKQVTDLVVRLKATEVRGKAAHAESITYWQRIVKIGNRTLMRRRRQY